MSRLYLEAAGVLDKILYKKVGVKDAVYGSKCSPKQKPALLAMISKTVSNQKLLNEALNSVGAWKEEVKMRKGLLLVMASELLLGSGQIRGGGHVKRYLTERLDQLKDFMQKSGKIVVEQPSNSKKDFPRYVRVNPSRWKSLGSAIAHLKSNGITEVVVDDSVPNLLVVEGKHTKDLVQLESVKRGDILLQDKSTCVSAHALLRNRPPAPSPPIHVIDACSAPGGKTLHILEMLRPGDSLTAVELDEKRAKILNERLLALGDMKKGVKVQVLNCDFLKLFQDDARLSSPVTHINLDPSCSGTGMDGPKTKGEERLRTLASFQSKMLKHAMNAFDQVEVVCYSTCSVLSVENEEVVNSTIDGIFGIDPKPLPAWWKTTGDDGFIRTNPETDNCRGFFLAKLVRKQ
jgi:putative methyltransferase